MQVNNTVSISNGNIKLVTFVRHLYLRMVLAILIFRVGISAMQTEW